MRLYTENYLWVEHADSCCRLGLSRYAVKKLNKILFFDFMVSPDDFCDSKKQIALLESIKIVWEITSPFPLKVKAVNQKLTESPDILNSDPESGNAWLIVFCAPSMPEGLMTNEQFEKYIATQ